MELHEAIVQHARELGNVAAAKFYGTVPPVIGMWKKGISKPKPEHEALFLAKDNPKPDPSYQSDEVSQTEVSSAPNHGSLLTATQAAPLEQQVNDQGSEEQKTENGKKLAICFPCYRQTNPLTLFSILSIFNKQKHHFILEHGTDLIPARNRLAKQFLDTGVEWSFWLDDDMVPVIGNSAWWRKVCLPPDELDEQWSRLHVLSRLESHGKKCISAIYFGRSAEGKGMYYEAITNTEENKFSHKAPRPELRETKGMAMGCALIHRDVFLDVMRHYPDLVPTEKEKAFPFFTPFGNHGEDIAFSIRARAAGHTLYVDMGCLAAHVGYNVWGPWNTLKEKR